MVALNKFLNLEEVQSGLVGETISSNGHGRGVGSLDAYKTKENSSWKVDQQLY